MRSSDFILLFFIIYDVLMTWILFYIYWKTREVSKEKSEYINDLLNELAKVRKK